MKIKRVTMSVYVLECEAQEAVDVFDSIFYDGMPPAWRNGMPVIDDGLPDELENATQFLLDEEEVNN